LFDFSVGDLSFSTNQLLQHETVKNLKKKGRGEKKGDDLSSFLERKRK